MTKTDELTARQQQQAEALKRNLQLRKAQGQARRRGNAEKPLSNEGKQSSQALSSSSQDVKTVK